jgi:hypothetical protein
MLGVEKDHSYTARHSHPYGTVRGRIGMSGNVHHRVEGDVTGLGAASVLVPM